MKRLFVLFVLMGMTVSTTTFDECVSDDCNLNVDQNSNSGSILFKSWHNVSRIANFTKKHKKVHYLSVKGDGKIVLDTNDEEAGKCLSLKNK